MKRNTTLLLTLASVVVILGTSGCYTQMAVRDDYPRYEEYDYPEYSETYEDSLGNNVTNNYYDGYNRAGTYFSYYYPVRFGSVWSSCYDPWYYDYYTPPYWGYSAHYWDPFWYNPFWYSGGYYHHNYGHWASWNSPYYYGNSASRYTVRTDGTRIRTGGNSRTIDGRTRMTGATRSSSRNSGVSRSADGNSTIRSSSTRSRSTSGSSYDRLNTRTRDSRSSTTTAPRSGSGSSRSTTTAPRSSSGSSRSTTTAPRSGSGSSRSSESTRSRSGSGSSERSSSGSSRPSYSPPSRSSGSSSGSSRSSGSSSSGSSRGSSSSSGSSGRSRTR